MNFISKGSKSISLLNFLYTHTYMHWEYFIQCKIEISKIIFYLSKLLLKLYFLYQK
jgi:hypothetical protein